MECFLLHTEKTFHSVDHNFASVKKFGFGDNFIQWVRTIFENSESCIMNNRASKGNFKLERGDPPSPYLFVLAFEILFI